MADVVELQTRALIDGAMHLYRTQLGAAIVPGHAIFVSLEGDSVPSVLEFQPSESDRVLSIALWRGENALASARRNTLLEQEIVDLVRTNAEIHLIEYVPTARVKDEILEVLRVARAPHPKEGIVPAFMSMPLGRGYRLANKAERKLLLQLVQALRELLSRGPIPWTEILESTAMPWLQVSGSPMRPKIELSTRPVPPAWEQIDLSVELGERRSLPAVPIGSDIWRIYFQGGASTEDATFAVITDRAHDRIVAAGPLPDTSPLGLLLGVREVLSNAIELRGFKELPAVIEVDAPHLRGWLAQLLEPLSIACRSFELTPADHEWVDSRSEEIDDVADELAGAILSRKPSNATDWSQCVLHLVNAVANEIADLEIENSAAPSEHFFGDRDYLADIEDPEDAALHAFALYLVAEGYQAFDDLLTFAADPAKSPIGGFDQLVPALRAARTSFYRIAGIGEADTVLVDDLLTGDRIEIQSASFADMRNINAVFGGRIVRVGGIALAAEFTPLLGPELFRRALVHLDDLRLDLDANGLAENPRLLGQLWPWFDDLDDETCERDDIASNDSTGADRIDSDAKPEFARSLTAELHAAIDRKHEWLPGVTLRRIVQTERGRRIARLVVAAWPSHGYADGGAVEPDRAAVLAELGVR